MTNLDKLSGLMVAHSLTPQMVADLLGISRLRVYSWFKTGTARRNMPDTLLKLLRHELKDSPN